MPSLFKFKVAEADRSGYFHTRWDRAVPVNVVADNKQEALEGVWALMGDARNGRYWTARLQSVEPGPITDTANAMENTK